MNFYSHDLRKIFLWVLLIHIGIALLGHFGLPNFDFKKRPDLTIEFSVLAPSSGAKTNQSSQVPISDTKKTEPQRPKDKDGTLSQMKPQVSQGGSAASVAGPAAALTADADYKAAYLKNPKPPYPPLAVRLRLEGKVILLAEVQSNGKPGKVVIESSSGHELLDQSALQTVKQWQFSPARKDGVIISQIVRIPINFNLKSK